MDDRRALHTLVDQLPPSALLPAIRFLAFLRQQAPDSLRSVLDAAPIDDEPITEDDLAAIREGLDEKAGGRTVPHDEVKRLLREEG